MASYYAEQGLDLYEAMDKLYQRYGYYLNKTISATFAGAAGAQKITDIMSRLRKDPPCEFCGLRTARVIDYSQKQEMERVSGLQKEAPQELPQANVLEFRLEGNNKIIIRPSGTEPKIKAYIFSYGSSREEATRIQNELSSVIDELFA